MILQSIAITTTPEHLPLQQVYNRFECRVFLLLDRLPCQGKEPSLSYCLPISGRNIVRFKPFFTTKSYIKKLGVPKNANFFFSKNVTDFILCVIFFSDCCPPLYCYLLKEEDNSPKNHTQNIAHQASFQKFTKIMSQTLLKTKILNVNISLISFFHQKETIPIFCIKEKEKEKEKKQKEKKNRLSFTIA